MNKAPVLSCCLTYGFETSDTFSIAMLLQRMLKVHLDWSDRPDMGGVVYEFKSWKHKVGELQSAILYANYVDGSGWREPAFKNCPLVSDICWETTNLIELGRLAAAVETYNDPRIHLLRYSVNGDFFAGGIVDYLIRREFLPDEERELRWDSHFKDCEVEDEDDDFDEDDFDDE